MAPSPFPAVEVAVAPFPCLAVEVAVAPFPCLVVVVAVAPFPCLAVEVAEAPFPCLAVVAGVAPSPFPAVEVAGVPFPCLVVVAGVGQLASTSMVEEEVQQEELLSQVVEAEGQPSSAWKPGVSSVEAKVLAVELSWQVGLAQEQEQVVPEHESQEVVSLTLRWMAWFWRGTLEVEG